MMANGGAIGQDKLVGDVEQCVKRLEAGRNKPCENQCAQHGDLAEGVKCLLLIEMYRLRGPARSRRENFIRVGQLTVSGTVPVIAVAVIYLLLRLHGVQLFAGG